MREFLPAYNAAKTKGPLLLHPNETLYGPCRCWANFSVETPVSAETTLGPPHAPTKRIDKLPCLDEPRAVLEALLVGRGD